jgi:WD40 repeat protein
VVALSPDGRSWAFADRSGTIEVRAVDTARPATRIAGTTPVTALGWSADGRSLASGDTAGGLVVTGLSPVRAIDRFAGRNHEVRLVALPGQTGQLVSLDNTTTLSADSLSRNDFMSSVPSRPAIAVATAQSGAVMAVGEAGGWVSIRDATTLEERRRFWLGPYPGAPDDAMTSELRRVTALAVTPDGSVVVAADRSGHLRAWSTADGTVTWSADDVPVSYLDISRDGTMLATSGAHAASGDPQTDPDVQSVATTFTLWDLRSHRQLFTDDLRDLVTPWSPTNSPTPVDVTFSPDGTTVALGFYGTFNGVIVYDAASHRRVLTRSSATDASFHGVAALMFSADSSTLLVREPSDEITGFRLPGGDVTTRLSTSTGREADLALADGGRWLVGTTTSSLDVWDGATGQLALSGLRLSSDGALRRLPVVATSDAHILVGTSTRVLRLDMDPARWAALACTLAGRSMTQAEWARYLPGRPYAPACQPASGAPGRAVIPG